MWSVVYRCVWILFTPFRLFWQTLSRRQCTKIGIEKNNISRKCFRLVTMLNDSRQFWIIKSMFELIYLFFMLHLDSQTIDGRLIEFEFTEFCGNEVKPNWSHWKWPTLIRVRYAVHPYIRIRSFCSYYKLNVRYAVITFYVDRLIHYMQTSLHTHHHKYNQQTQQQQQL